MFVTKYCNVDTEHLSQCVFVMFIGCVAMLQYVANYQSHDYPSAPPGKVIINGHSI